MGTKFILGQEDGTVAGGDPRGIGSVDLQMSRSISAQVASGDESVIIGGNNNRASGYHSIAGGGQNNASGYTAIALGENCQSSGQLSVSLGGANTASSNYSTVSGGQGNTASGLRAIVLGGGNNTSSGQDSIVGGNSSNASGTWAVALGYANSATNTATFATGREALATHGGAIAMGNNNPVALATNAVAIGSSARAEATNSVALGASSYSTMYNQFSTLGGGIGQASDLKSYRTASLTTGANIVLSLDGTGTTNLIIPSGTSCMWKVKVEYVGTITTITGTATGLTVGDSVYGEENFGFKRLAGTSTMGPIMNETQSSDNAIMDTCSLAVTAGASQEMALTFTGPTFAGGGSVTMRVVAKVALVEVAF